MLKKYLNAFVLSLSIFFTCSLTAHADPLADLFRHKGDPVEGNPNGKVTVVEFFDYQCSHCENMAAIVNVIKDANPDVRFIFKDFPIRGEASHYAALAALAANKQHKYKELNFALLTQHPETRDEIIKVASSIGGLNIAQLKKDIASTDVKNQLAANLALAQELNINGTPAFYIGKTNATNSADVIFVLGEMSQNEFQEAIDKAKR